MGLITDILNAFSTKQEEELTQEVKNAVIIPNVETEPEVVRQVISSETSRTINAMMVSVVNKGHANLARVPGYFVGGKTGTAQIAKSSGVGYEMGRHNDTFVGFTPVSKPEFVVLTKINEPKDVAWAASSAAPLFGDIMKFLVDYYQIPPDEVQ